LKSQKVLSAPFHLESAKGKQHAFKRETCYTVEAPTHDRASITTGSGFSMIYKTRYKKRKYLYNLISFYILIDFFLIMNNIIIFHITHNLFFTF
jgi:hypothetical protein